jgi:hypothetical protein
MDNCIRCYYCEEIPYILCSDCTTISDNAPGILCASCYDSKHDSIGFHEHYQLLDSYCVPSKHKNTVREEVYHNLCPSHQTAYEFKEDCSICHYFRTHASHRSHEDEAEAVQILGELLKNDLFLQSEAMLKKVVAITTSASVLARTAEVLQKELDQKRNAISNSEREILTLIQERYSNLIDEAIQQHNKNMEPLIKEKEEIAFSVSRAMAVYKDVQDAFSKDVLSFYSEIKNVKSRLTQSTEDVDAIITRLKEYEVPQTEGTDIVKLDDSLLRNSINDDSNVFFSTAISKPTEGGTKHYSSSRIPIFDQSRDKELMRFKVTPKSGLSEIDSKFEYGFETVNQDTICFHPKGSSSEEVDVRIMCCDSKVLHFYIFSEQFYIMQPFEMPFVVGSESLERNGDVIICTNQDRLEKV